MSIIGERLKKAREKKELSQVQVMELTGINNKTLSGYENNVSTPDPDTFKLLANLYGVTIDYLMGNESESTSINKKNKLNDKKDPEDIFAQLGTIINRDAKPLTQKDKERLIRIIESAWPVDDEEH